MLNDLFAASIIIGGALIAGILAGLVVWFIRNDGKGDHAGGDHSFRPATGPPRPLTLPYYEFGSYSTPPNLPGRGPEGALGSPRTSPAGEPDTLDRLIQASQILAPHVYAGLSKSGAEDTVTSATTFEPWIRALLTVPIGYLPDMVRADQMSLALAVRS